MLETSFGILKRLKRSYVLSSSMSESGLIKCEETIRQRIKEFETLGNKGEVTFDFSPFLELKIRATIKSELAFCISTANSSAAAGLKFQKALEGKTLEDITTEQFQKILRDSGVRFHNRKATYIREAMRNIDSIQEALQASNPRDYLVKNVKGLGFKEASHFLRNIGRRDVAIVDRHIIKCLMEENYVEDSDMNPQKYAECEKVLQTIAADNEVCVATLDLKLWYGKTGKILK